MDAKKKGKKLRNDAQKVSSSSDNAQTAPKKRKSESDGLEKRKKPRKVQSRQAVNASDDDEESDEEDNELQLTNRNAKTEEFSFDFSDMNDTFYGGIQLFLAKQLCSTTMAHDIAEVVCRQDEVGTVVHCEGEQDAFAYSTILPANSVKTFALLPEVLLAVQGSDRASRDFREIIQAVLSADGPSQYGILLYDRFVNLPVELIYHLSRNLKEDLDWITTTATNSEISAELIAQFRSIRKLIFFVPLCANESSSSSSSSSASTVEDVTGRSTIIFDRFEDETYFQHADVAFQIKLGTKPFKISNYVMMVVPKSKLGTIVDELQTLLNYQK